MIFMKNEKQIEQYFKEIKGICDNISREDIDKAIELLFKVKVTNVNVCNFQGKSKQFAKRPGKQKAWKKAYVTLEAGQEINFETRE